MEYARRLSLATSHIRAVDTNPPVPKVIDFGVAKTLHQRLTERTVYTSFAQVIGTPLYMSPAQAELSGLDIDTRSDVYSPGVLLYGLLTGTTSFDKVNADRVIAREHPPLRPGFRVQIFTAKVVGPLHHQYLPGENDAALFTVRLIEFLRVS